MGKLYLNKDVFFLKKKKSKHPFPQTRRYGLCCKGKGALPIPERPAGLHCWTLEWETSAELSEGLKGESLHEGRGWSPGKGPSIRVKCLHS